VRLQTTNSDHTIRVEEDANTPELPPGLMTARCHF
jgi:hypothetical protein